MRRSVCRGQVFEGVVTRRQKSTLVLFYHIQSVLKWLQWITNSFSKNKCFSKPPPTLLFFAVALNILRRFIFGIRFQIWYVWHRDFDETPKNYFTIYETIWNSVWFHKNFASLLKFHKEEISKSFSCNRYAIIVSFGSKAFRILIRNYSDLLFSYC